MKTRVGLKLALEKLLILVMCLCCYEAVEVEENSQFGSEKTFHAVSKSLMTKFFK